MPPVREDRKISHTVRSLGLVEALTIHGGELRYQFAEIARPEVSEPLCCLRLRQSTLEGSDRHHVVELADMAMVVVDWQAVCCKSSRVQLVRMEASLAAAAELACNHRDHLPLGLVHLAAFQGLGSACTSKMGIDGASGDLPDSPNDL